MTYRTLSRTFIVASLVLSTAQAWAGGYADGVLHAASGEVVHLSAGGNAVLHAASGEAVRPSAGGYAVLHAARGEVVHLSAGGYAVLHAARGEAAHLSVGGYAAGVLHASGVPHAAGAPHAAGVPRADGVPHAVGVPRSAGRGAKITLPADPAPATIHIIPAPVSVKAGGGVFQLNGPLAIQKDGEGLDSVATWFTRQMGWGGSATVAPGASAAARGQGQLTLSLHMKDRNILGREGYLLSVTTAGIKITANDPAGVFHGLQTLLQLMPVGVGNGGAMNGSANGESTSAMGKGAGGGGAMSANGTMTSAAGGAMPMSGNGAASATIPCVEILDYPRFGWRGLELDVSRHFFTKTEVLRYIDEMARYKFNTLHLHLSDDQGWRLEIKSLPRLTEHGAWRVARTGRWGEFLPPMIGESTPYGGFYTQDDMREIIAYAQSRYITILPEIDVPAHSLALISSYTNLSCTQQEYPVNPGSRGPVRQDNALCVGNDSVYAVLDKIFTEVAALFPCEYIHVGGDEAYKGFWAECPKCKRLMKEQHLKDVDELQSYFIRRMEAMLKAKGKKLIGWDEILEGGLAPEATVMSWRGMSGGIAAAKQGHKVVMTPWDFTYLDLYQGESTVEPPTYGMCRLKDSYTYDPVPDSVDEKLILGGQGNLWSESVPNFRHAEYMTWPRGLALSEVYWSPKAARNWDDFTGRMEAEFTRMDAAGIKYARSAFNAVFTPKKIASGDFEVSLSTEITGLDIYYTFDDTNPDATYPKYDGHPLRWPLGAAQLNVITYRNGQPAGQQINIRKDELQKRLDQGKHVY